MTRSPTVRCIAVALASNRFGTSPQRCSICATRSTAPAHSHLAHIGIGGRYRGRAFCRFLGPPFGSFELLLLAFGKSLLRSSDPPCAFFRGPQGMRLTLAFVGAGVLFQFAVQRRDAFGNRRLDAIELLPSRQRIVPGAGAYFRSVDRQLFQADQTFSDQRCQALRQRPAVAPERREHVVIGRNPAGESAICGVVFAQPFDGARRADAVQRGIQPQCQQHRRFCRRASRQIVTGFDASVKRGKIQRLDKRPDQTSTMPRRQLAIQIDRVPPQLLAVWQQQAKALAHRESSRRLAEGIRKLAAGESGNCGDGTKYTGCRGLDYGLEGQPPTPSLVIRTRKLSGIEPLGYLTDVLQRIVSGRTKTRTARTVAVELASAIRLRCDHRYDSSSCRLVGVPQVDAVVAPRRLRAANDGSAKHPIIMPIFSRPPIAPTS
jgi:hypothetical protein